MPDLTATIILAARDLASSTIDGVRGSIETLTDSASRGNSALTGILQGVELGAGIAAFGALSNAIEDVVGSSIKFQTSLTELQNNTTLTTQQTEEAGRVVIDLSNKYGVATDSITAGYRHVMDIVQNAAASQEILNEAVEGSAASGAKASDVANVLAGVMHEYGTDVARAADGTVDLVKTHENAAHTLGVMTAAAQDANSTLDQWTGSLSAAIGIAASGGQPLENIGAIFGALTLHGFPDAANAGVQVKDMLVQFAHLTPAATAELERLGKVSGIDVVADLKAMNEGSMTLVDFLGQLRDAYQKVGLSEAQFREESEKLIAGQRGGLGLNALLTTGYQDMLRIQADLADQTRVNTVVDDTWNRTKETAGKQWDILKEKVDNFGITLGSRLLPQITPVLKAMDDALPGALDAAGDAFNRAAVATEPLRDALGDLANHAVDEFKTLADAAQKMATGDLPDALGEATGAIAGFGGYLIDHVARWTVSLEMWALDAIPGLMRNLGDVLGSIGDWISGTGAGGISEKMPTWLVAFSGWADNVYAPLVEKLGEMLGKLGGWITGYAAPFLGGKLVEWGGEFATWVVDATPKALTALGNLGGQVVRWVGDQVPTWAFELGKWTGEFTRWVGDAANALPGKLGDIGTSIKGWVAGDGLKSTADAAGQMGKSFMDGLTEALLHGIPDMVRGLQSALDGALNAFKAGFTAAGGVTPGHPNSAQYDFSASIGAPQYAGSPAITGAGQGIPAAGDVNGWRDFLRPFVPEGLQGDNRFLDILLAGGKGESGLNANRVQDNIAPSLAAKGVFQFDPGGMGAGLSDNQLFDPSYEASRIVPEYAKAYQNAPQGLSGADLAAYVAGAAERPGGWTPGAVDYATAGNYRRAYTEITGGAGEGNYGPMPTYGPEPVAGLAAGNQAIGGTQAGSDYLAGGGASSKLNDLLATEGINWTKTLQTETNRIAKSVQDETTKLASADADAARATTKVDTDSARAISDVGTSRVVQDDITQRKNALAQTISDDKTANDTKVAAQELTYQRGLQNDQIAQSRRLEDTQIATQQALAAQALTHSRTLEDQEIQYQNGLQKDATAHARALQDAKILSDQKLALAATEHQRTLQDQQTEVNAELAAADLVHQRQLQDAAIPVDQGLQDTATAHGRQLQDQQTAYDLQKAQQRDAAAFQLQMAQATTDAQRQQLTASHDQTVQNAALQAQYAAEDLAHSRSVQDQEAVYQEGLQAAALARSRAQQDAEIQYQAGVADKATADQRVRDDKEAAYQQNLAAVALNQSRIDADTEQSYQDGLKKVALDHSRTLQDAQILYENDQAKKALDARRVLEDAALADQRTKEDAAIQHKADLEAAARQFAAGEKAKQDALDKQLADEADKRAIDKINDNAALQKKDIADRLTLQKQAIAEAAQTQLDAEKTTFDQAAAAIIDKARIAVTKAGGDFGPVEDAMKASVAGMDAAFATAHDSSATALVDLAAKTLANLGDRGVVPTAIAETARVVEAQFGVSDRAVELFGQQFGVSWDVARPLLGQIEQGIYTNLGANGLIPNHISVSNAKVIEFAKQWGISWPEAAGILTTESDRIKATFGAGGEVPNAMAQSATAAQGLNAAIQAIQDKTVTITVNTQNNTAGGNVASGGALGGIGSSSSNNQGGGDFDPSSAGTAPAGSPAQGHAGSSGPGGIWNDPSTGHPYAHALGGVTRGPIFGWDSAGNQHVAGEGGGPEAIIPLGDYFVQHKSDAVGGMSDTQIDRLAEKVAEAVVRGMSGISLDVGINPLQTAILQLKRRGGAV